MVDKKFSKEQWFNLSQDERDFYTLEFKQAVERRQKLTILSTRILAGFLILFLFFMALFYLNQAVNTTHIRNYMVKMLSVTYVA